MEGDEELTEVDAQDEATSRMGLGRTLAELRKERGLTGERLGQMVRMSQGKISKLERGALRASPEDVQRILDALAGEQAVDRDLERDLVERARRLRDGGSPRRPGPAARGPVNQRDYYEAEQRAALIRNFEPIAVPGLLQISEYTRRLVNAYHAVVVGEKATKTLWPQTAETVALRARRQQLLYDPDKTFKFVIMESVLGNRFATPGVMLAQVDRIEQASALDNVEIRIVRSSTELGYAPIHGFNIFDDELVITEMLTATTSHDRRSVDFYAHFFETYFELGDPDLSPILELYKWAYATDALPKHPPDTSPGGQVTGEPTDGN